IPTVTLELTKSTGMETPPGVFYRLTLSNVLVSSQKNTANNGDDRPRETITLNFTKIKVEYWTQDAKGTLTPVTPVQFDLTKGIAS
ncbi:MAG TPA: type VI secretion system tube protein Hcp, partial [Haloferula sp.]